MSSAYQSGKSNPFERSLNVHTVDEALYGSIGNQIPIREIPLQKIWTDVAQPRRSIPLRIRGEWLGDPSDVREILENWDAQVRWAINLKVPFGSSGWYLYCEAIQEAADKAKDLPRDVDLYIDLVALAASIEREGLANAITIQQRNGGYVVETGERRLLAYHLLQAHLGERFARVPARVVDQADVWRQAAENGARRPLNAIGMARQLALLIMDMYAGDRGVSFDRYEAAVLPGGCDRRYYAQVANGNIYRIKPGMLARILEVTGLKSQVQLSQYRSLLQIDDDLWMEADREDWAEYKIRQVVSEQNQATITAVMVPVQNDDFDGEESPDSPITTTAVVVPTEQPTITAVMVPPTLTAVNVPQWTDQELDFAISRLSYAAIQELMTNTGSSWTHMNALMQHGLLTEYGEVTAKGEALLARYEQVSRRIQERETLTAVKVTETEPDDEFERELFAPQKARPEMRDDSLVMSVCGSQNAAWFGATLAETLRQDGREDLYNLYMVYGRMRGGTLRQRVEQRGAADVERELGDMMDAMKRANDALMLELRSMILHMQGAVQDMDGEL